MKLISLVPFVLVSILFTGKLIHALEPEDGALFVRVVDTGAGLCAVVKIPGDHYMVYDAGDFRSAASERCFDAIQEITPEDEEIDLSNYKHTEVKSRDDGFEAISLNDLDFMK